MKKHSALLTIGAVAAGAWALSRSARPNYSLEGKIVVITGGSRGLGLVMARQICAEGGRVVLLARDSDELGRAREDLTSRGSEVLTISCDLTQRAQIENAVNEIVERFGGVDVLINNAGIIEVGPLEHMERGDFEKAMDLHFWAAYELIMETAPHMRRRGGGRIVNIASIGGQIAVPHLAAYCASKFALVGLSDSVRTELARDRIYVTTVTPGLMRTGSHVNARFKGNHAAEYGWFSTAASLPFASIGAERAAKKILLTCRRGQPALTTPLAARVLIVGNTLFPNTAGRAMRLVNAFLPGAVDSSGDELRSGRQSRAHSAVPDWLTQLADRAIERNNE